MLRYAADRRTMVWSFILFPSVIAIQYAMPQLAGWMLPIGLYMGFCYGVFSHNHNHTPTFVKKSHNTLFAAYLSFIYGYPTFAWIPTHNLNHHRFVNKAGDATITWRYSRENTWTVAWTYFFVSSYWQAGPIKEYLAKAKAKHPKLYRQAIGQYVALIVGQVSMLALAVRLHGTRTGLWVYTSALLLPGFFALWSMMFINYIQHVHCDPWSKHNHSRNFVSPYANYVVFNAGYHAAHHENSGMHWSELPGAHAKIADQIDPELRQASIFWFCIRSYLLGAFSDRFRTKQVGRAADDPPNGELSLETAEVAAEELGVNAQMA